MPLPSPKGLRAGRQMQVESSKSRLRGRPRVSHLPFRQALLRVASRRIRSDFLPRLRAETSALARCPKLSTPWANSKANEGRHYGVQARRRVGESARGVLGCTLQRLALLDKTQLHFSSLREPESVIPPSKSLPSSSNRARTRATPQMGVFQQPVRALYSIGLHLK
jgi:hypothetical protein